MELFGQEEYDHEDEDEHFDVLDYMSDDDYEENDRTHLMFCPN